MLDTVHIMLKCQRTWTNPILALEVAIKERINSPTPRTLFYHSNHS